MAVQKRKKYSRTRLIRCRMQIFHVLGAAPSPPPDPHFFPSLTVVHSSSLTLPTTSAIIHHSLRGKSSLLDANPQWRQTAVFGRRRRRGKFVDASSSLPLMGVEEEDTSQAVGGGILPEEKEGEKKCWMGCIIDQILFFAGVAKKKRKKW